MKRSLDVIGIILLIIAMFALLTLAAYSINGQTPESNTGPDNPMPSGGQFTLQRSVIAGGGTAKQQGQFSEHATAGQSVSGSQSSGGSFRVRSGFWTPDDLMPTAANVSISGRIMTDTGLGLRSAEVTLTDANGTVRRTASGSFGYYRFDDVPTGQTYVIRVVSRRFQFSPRAISVVDELTEIDLIGEPLPLPVSTLHN